MIIMIIVSKFSNLLAKPSNVSKYLINEVVYLQDVIDLWCDQTASRWNLYQKPLTIIILISFFIALGPKQDFKHAKEFIARMFINVTERSNDIYPHFTCATDTDNIKFVFDVVKNHILQQHIVEVIPGL